MLACGCRNEPEWTEKPAGVGLRSVTFRNEVHQRLELADLAVAAASRRLAFGEACFALGQIVVIRIDA